MVPRQPLDLSSPRYEVQKSKFRQTNKLLDTFNETLNLSNDDEKFWWDAISGQLAASLVRAGYDDERQTQFLRLYQRSLSALGPRPYGDGQACRHSFLTPDSTPVELSWSYNGSKSIMRFSFDPYDPPGKRFCQYSTKALVQDFAKLSGTKVSFEMYDVISHAMGFGPETKGKDQRPSHFFMGFDLLTNGTILVKGYVSILLKPLEPPEAQAEFVEGVVPVLDTGLTAIQSYNEIAEELIRTLDSKIFSATPIMPAFKVLQESNQSCPENSKQVVRMVAWDFVNPLKARLKVYVFKENTSLKNLHDIWTLGGRLSGPEIDVGLEAIDELWSLFYCPHDIPFDEELKGRDGTSQPILGYFEFRPGAMFPAPKLFLQPGHFRGTDAENVTKLACWFDKRGWPLGKTWSDDFQDIHSHQDLSQSHDLQNWVSLGVQEGGGLKVVVYMSPFVFSSMSSSPS